MAECPDLDLATLGHPVRLIFWPCLV